MIFGIGFAAIIAGTWWLWWRLPKRQADRLRPFIRDAKSRADVEDNIRKTIGQLLGGIAVLIGAGFALIQFFQQQQASHDLLVSGQLSKGFEQLGSEKVLVRLGGVFALEGALSDRRYGLQVLGALCALVREAAHGEKSDVMPPDVHAVVDVLDRHDFGALSKFIDLNGGQLRDANLSQVNFRGANLSGTNLSGANLFRATLAYTVLSDTNLTVAFLEQADLSGAILTGTVLRQVQARAADFAGASILKEANFAQASLSSANFSRASVNSSRFDSAGLDGASFSGAVLIDVYFGGANLTEVDFRNAHFDRVNLTAALLRGAQITQQQLDKACGVDVKGLPQGLTIKECVTSTK
jgi:uncharacterized protein YjbI with pentapeptide repeats